MVTFFISSVHLTKIDSVSLVYKGFGFWGEVLRYDVNIESEGEFFRVTYLPGG